MNDDVLGRGLPDLGRPLDLQEPVGAQQRFEADAAILRQHALAYASGRPPAAPRAAPAILRRASSSMITDTIQKNDERNIALPSASPAPGRSSASASLILPIANGPSAKPMKVWASRYIAEAVERIARRHQLVGGGGAGSQPQRRRGDQNQEADDAAVERRGLDHQVVERDREHHRQQGDVDAPARPLRLEPVGENAADGHADPAADRRAIPSLSADLGAAGVEVAQQEGRGPERHAVGHEGHGGEAEAWRS